MMVQRTQLFLTPEQVDQHHTRDRSDLQALSFRLGLQPSIQRPRGPSNSGSYAMAVALAVAAAAAVAGAAAAAAVALARSGSGNGCRY